MTDSRTIIGAAAAFALGFVGVLAYQRVGATRPLAAALVPSVSCDIGDDLCRQRLRAQAELYFSAGDDAAGSAVFRRLYLAGDIRSAFFLGWHHEEIYRKAVGLPLPAVERLPEDRLHGADGLPRGDGFLKLVDARSVNHDASTRVDDARAKAWLWYAAAAQAGFAPAANNLAQMYRSGIVGPSDQLSARRWFVAAWDRGSPVAAYNLEAMRIAGYDDPTTDCIEEVGRGWFPLINRPADIDMTEQVLTRTRFRGRPIDPPFRVEIEREVLRLRDPEKWRSLHDDLGHLLEQPAPTFAYVEVPLYDDETLASRKTVPTFEEARDADRARAKRRGDCSAVPVDPRAARIRAADEEQFRDLVR